MERTEVVKDKRQLALMITTLVALLLISQLSLASGRSETRFLLDNNYYSSLEAFDLESNNPNHFTPDFINVNSEQKQNNVFAWLIYRLIPISIENQSRSGSIRSPPLFA